MSREKTARITVNADTLRSEIRDKSVRVLDIRKEEDYKKDHIPDAVNFPLSTLLADDEPSKVLQFVQSFGIDDETPVVVYDDTFGALASRVAWTLQYIGHDEVSLLDVTFSSWKRLGLETSLESPSPAKKNHSLRLQPQILATADALMEEKGKGAILVDNRERLNFLENHIPGAINMPYRMLASPQNILRPKDDLKRLMQNRRITSDSEVITYCGSVGTLSGLGYYALKSVGIPNVKLYVRSFKEWKSLEKPIERQSDANYWDLSAE
ncbi:MAG: sulfurtransferase [Thaumarchaeota archaeon]|nr:sulfurtransferase [Nitrososphaerota archaeon]